MDVTNGAGGRAGGRGERGGGRKRRGSVPFISNEGSLSIAESAHSSRDIREGRVSRAHEKNKRANTTFILTNVLSKKYIKVLKQDE